MVLQETPVKMQKNYDVLSGKNLYLCPTNENCAMCIFQLILLTKCDILFLMCNEENFILINISTYVNNIYCYLPHIIHVLFV